MTDGRTDGPTDRRTDGRTDTPSYRDPRTHLKTGCKRALDNCGDLLGNPPSGGGSTTGEMASLEGSPSDMARKGNQDDEVEVSSFGFGFGFGLPLRSCFFFFGVQKIAIDADIWRRQSRGNQGLLDTSWLLFFSIREHEPSFCDVTSQNRYDR